jgi:hypothetical protein
MTEEHREAYFTLTFSPGVELVSTVRRYVTEFYETILGDADVASRVGLATHELLENAVKYGPAEAGEASLCVFVAGKPGNRSVSVQTKNRATNADITALQDILERFQTGDRDEVYQEIIRASAVTDASKSGLGIARVCVEGEMQISAAIEDGVVSIDARTHVDEKEDL